MKIIKGSTGFTTIELLIVISLIGLLASLGTLRFVGAQRSSKDVRRGADLIQYQNALERFSGDNFLQFPSRTASAGVPLATTICADLSLSVCPEDIRNTTDNTFQYLYQSITDQIIIFTSLINSIRTSFFYYKILR